MGEAETEMKEDSATKAEPQGEERSSRAAPGREAAKDDEA